MATEKEALKEISEKFAGTWKNIRCDNYEEFLKEKGLPFIPRKMLCWRKPEVEIHIDGEDIQIIIKTPLFINNMTYRLNEKTAIGPENTIFNIMTTYEFGKIVSKQVLSHGIDSKTMVTEREINMFGELVIKYYIRDVVSVQVFKKL